MTVHNQNITFFQQIYDVLEKIYQEMYNTFQFKEFHMGADEVTET